MLLVEALQALTEKKRNVALLSYFLEMTEDKLFWSEKMVKFPWHCFLTAACRIYNNEYRTGSKKYIEMKKEKE